jgi:thiol-disulfide isomerase/thioredoxin
MKQVFAILSLSILLSFNTNAQVQYEISKDPQNGLKTLKGILSIDVLKNDSAFAWMRNDISWYKPNATAVTNLKAVKDTVQLMVFVGTWCEDSHIVFPQLLKLCSEAGFDTKRITVIGVDRKKTTLGSLCEALGVTKAPTILVLKGGKEMGRVEEFGTSGMYDKDLGEVLLKAK